MRITILDVEYPKHKPFRVYIYPTIKSVYEAFFDGELKGKIMTSLDNAKIIKTPVKEAMKNGKKQGCWGFVHDKNSIHLWFNHNIVTTDLYTLLSHEIAHLTRPYHISFKKEEAKAQKYQDVTELAISLGDKILKKDYNEQT